MNAVIHQAASDISGITAVVDSDGKTKHQWAGSFIATALATAIALIPGVGPEASLVLTEAVKNPAGRAPAITRRIWSTASGDPEDLQELENNQLASLLNGTTNSSVQSVLDYNINTTLALLQGVEIALGRTDYDDFLEFTRGGQYSDSGNKLPLKGDTSETLPKLSTTLNTYLISTLLAQNGFYAVLIPGLNPAAIYSDPTSNCPSWAGSSCNAKSKDLGCRGALDQFDLCANLWYSQAHNSSYLLLKNGKTDVKQSSQILQKMYTGNYASGESLFEGAAICELQSVFPFGSRPFYTNSGVDHAAGFVFMQGTFPLAAPYAKAWNSTMDFLAIRTWDL